VPAAWWWPRRRVAQGTLFPCAVSWDVRRGWVGVRTVHAPAQRPYLVVASRLQPLSGCRTSTTARSVRACAWRSSYPHSPWPPYSGALPPLLFPLTRVRFPLIGCASPLTLLTRARRVMSAATPLAPDLFVEEPLPEMEIDGAAAVTPPMAPQSALPPVTAGAVGSTPPAPPPLATPESGATQGGAASAPPIQAATPMVVESGRPEDLDWWVPPSHQTAMGEGGHLLSIYRTFPDSEQVTAWSRRLARFPRQVALPAGWLVDLPALL